MPTSHGKVLIGSYLPPEEKSEFQRWCEKRELTVSQGIRLLIRRKLRQDRELRSSANT